MEKSTKIKVIIDKNLLKEISDIELNFLKTGSDIYYLSTRKSSESNTIYIKETDLVNNISSFMINLALMTKTTNIDNILFISDKKNLLLLLGNLNFKTMLIYNSKYDCVDYEATYEISNSKQIIKTLGQHK